MKTLHIPVEYKRDIELRDDVVRKLPKKIGLVSTIQFSKLIDDVKKQLEEKGVNVFVGKGKQPNKGQILGCDVSSAETVKGKVDAFLYIGDGEFHPIALGLLGKDVYCYNPFSSLFFKQDKSKIEKYKKRKKGAMIKYLSADKIGILVSVKTGQNNMNKAVSLKKRLEKEGKEAYIFLFETLNFNELENFNFVEAWVNTACPRIDEDINVVNIRDL